MGLLDRGSEHLPSADGLGSLASFFLAVPRLPKGCFAFPIFKFDTPSTFKVLHFLWRCRMQNSLGYPKNILSLRMRTTAPLSIYRNILRNTSGWGRRLIIHWFTTDSPSYYTWPGFTAALMMSVRGRACFRKRYPGSFVGTAVRRGPRLTAPVDPPERAFALCRDTITAVI